MSIKIALNSLSDEQRDRVTRELQFRPNETAYGPSKECICPYFVVNSDIYLPLAYSVKKLKLRRPSRKHYPAEDVLPFNGKLRPLQKTVKMETLEILSRTGSCIIALYCGAGKTFLSLHLANEIGFKALIIVHRIILINQWKNSIDRVFPGCKTQIITPKSTLDSDAKFYIMNAINVPKMSRLFFRDIGTCIVDECHTIATKKLSESLGYIAPRYLIGLSATPTRPDGMDVLLDVYFGKNRIKRPLHRKHIVYKVDTGFVPEFKLQRNGKVDWNSVLESQASSLERNNLIVKIVKHFRDRYFLILCKRVAQGNWLIQRLKEEGEDVTSLIGKQTEFDFDSRILVATIQKCGFGFDHPKLNTLLLAGDAEEYFVQYLGRVLRREEGEPWVFEFVDDFGILQKHYQTRKKVYLRSGGIIKDFGTSFPSFPS